eukprot:COSAG06_NODE_612_length_13800_cov_14.100650_3_plen_96_part_00
MTSLVISHVAFTELATNYGPIDQFWFDHGNDLFVDLVDEFQPDALVLGRDFISDGAPALALGGDGAGAKHAVFEPFYTKTDHFTKTGSGQTYRRS